MFLSTNTWAETACSKQDCDFIDLIGIAHGDYLFLIRNLIEENFKAAGVQTGPQPWPKHNSG